MGNFAQTFYFKDIFPTAESFSKYIVDYKLKYNDILYKYLFNRYCNYSIAYDTINAFERQLAVTWQNVVEQFEFRTKYIDELYSITIDDIITGSTMINVTADNNNTKLEKPLDILTDYVTNQSGTKYKTAKFSNYLQAIQKVCDRYIDDMLYQFKIHFITIYQPTEYYYKGEFRND